MLVTYQLYILDPRFVPRLWGRQSFYKEFSKKQAAYFQLQYKPYIKVSKGPSNFIIIPSGVDEIGLYRTKVTVHIHGWEDNNSISISKMLDIYSLGTKRGSRI